MKCCHDTPKLGLRFLVLAAITSPMLLLALLSGCGGVTGLVVELNPSANQAVDINQSVSFTAFVPGDATNAGVTWSLSSSHCKGPQACGTFSSSTAFAATYEAPKSVAALLTVTLTATSVSQTTAYATLNIVVSPAPVIATTSLPGVLNGADYSEQVIANGGVAPLVFTISSGGLPPGLSLNTNGFITGRTTSDGGTFPFTITVTDQGSPPLTASQAYTIVVAPAPPLSVATTSMPTAPVGSPYSIPLQASGGVPPLTWAVTSGALPPGLTLTPATGQISGTPTTQNTFTFTVQVTDSSLLGTNEHPQTASQPLSITVGPPGPLTIVTTALPQAETANLYSQTILTTGGIGPFTWAITSGILPSGMSLDASTGTISGTATAVSTNTFTIQVTDSESPPVSKSATLTITVITAANADNTPLLDGDYVFLFSGYNQYGPVVLGGTLVANGAGGLSGVIDSNNNNPTTNTTGNNGPGPTEENTMTGTYTIGSDGLGSMSMTINSIVFVYDFALDGQGNAQLIEGDENIPFTHGTGTLRKLPTTTPNFTPASFNGSYAFQFAGIDSSGKRASYVGILQANGAEVFENGNVDTNDGGSVGTNISGISGSYVVAQNGRGLATISIPSGPTLNFTFYMITPSDVLFMGFDDMQVTSNPMTTGEAILQTQSSFDASSMNGSSVVTATGQNSSGNASVLLGLLTANGANSVSAAINGNDGGAITSTSASGSYSVSSNGRVSTSGLGSQLAVLYLVSPNQGFVIGQDSTASSGVVEAQSGAPFNAASFTSYFTFGPPLTGSPDSGDGTASDYVGSFISNGISSLSGKITQDIGNGTPPNSNLSASGSYTVNANGSGSISFVSPVQLPSAFVFYLVSPTELRAISAATNDTHPSVFFLNH